MTYHHPASRTDSRNGMPSPLRISFSHLILQASILRQIVAGPRLQHPEANLDLCYVTDNSKVQPANQDPEYN